MGEWVKRKNFWGYLYWRKNTYWILKRGMFRYVMTNNEHKYISLHWFLFTAKRAAERYHSYE